MYKVLGDAGYATTLSSEESSSDIIRKLFRSDYKIIHLAGHGMFNTAQPDNSGMVIGNNVFLTTREIQQLSFIPELVFINCCHLGNINDLTEAAYQNRYKLAANLGTQLIGMGVKCVIAAGWAVNDTAALEFTEVFYSAMLSGSNFGDAVRAARKHCYDRHPYSNTWGAYQCYGDQFFTLKKIYSNKKQSLRRYFVADQVRLDLDNLINRIGANYSEVQKQNYKDEIQLILDSAAAVNIPLAALYESLGILYNRLGEEKISLEYFELFFDKNSEAFNVNSYVEYARLMMSYHSKDAQSSNKIQEVIDNLDKLAGVIPSYAIYNAMGTGYKSIARINTGANREKYLQLSVNMYLKAYENGKRAGVDNTMYALTNAYMLGMVLPEGKVELPHVCELEWSFNNITAFDNTLTFWDLMDVPRYWLCKYVMQQLGYDFEDGNMPVTQEEVIDAWKKVVQSGGVETHQQAMISKLTSMTMFYEPKKFPELSKQLNQIAEALK